MKAFKAFTKPFEAPQRSVKIKILLNFFSSSGIGTGRVNNGERFLISYVLVVTFHVGMDPTY